MSVEHYLPGVMAPASCRGPICVCAANNALAMVNCQWTTPEDARKPVLVLKVASAPELAPILPCPPPSRPPHFWNVCYHDLAML